MIRKKYKTIYVAAFVSVLLAVSLHTFAAPFFGEEAGLVLVEKNSVGHFIRVGKDITYRRYLYYFATKEGGYALLSGLAQMILTGYVDYQVAREVRNLAPSPFLKHAGFLLTLYSLPLMVRSTASWYTSKRLATEQIIIDSPHIQNRFYLELSYNPSGSGEVLKMLPIPARIARPKLSENNQQPSPTLNLWDNFYKALLKKNYVSVELSWFEHDKKTGILVNFTNGAGDKQSRLINVEYFQREQLPASIESLLHNEWKPDSHPQHISINLPVISLLKGDVIQRVMELVLSEDTQSVVIPSGSLLTFISSTESEPPHEINLCQMDQVYCDTFLQLFWRPLPYPHYRLALKFADSEYIRHHESVLHSTLAQPEDINLAEQLTQLFERIVFSAVMEFIRQQQEYAELSLPESGNVMVASDLARYSIVKWRGVDFLPFLIAKLAKNGFISAASQLVISPDMLHRSMEKALEAGNPDLYTGLARVSGELYLQHILSNYSDSEAKAQEWLRHLSADTQEKLITIGLDADQADADFLLKNTRPEAVAQSVFQYLQKSEQKRNNWERIQINHGMLILKLVISHQCKPCMPPLLQWLSAKSGDQLTEGLANLELSEEQTRWFADTTVSMINSKDIEPSHITELLVGIAKNLSFSCIKVLIKPLPETVSTSLMIGLEEQTRQCPEHFGTVLESLSELQAGHYLATLTNSQKLWESSVYNAYMATQKLVTSLHSVARFKPNEARFETIKGWSRIILSAGNIVGKKDLQEDLTCSICQEVFKKPVVLPCGHTSCRHCITDWVQNSRSCPDCRFNIPTRWAFPPNHAIEKLINNRKLQSE